MRTTLLVFLPGPALCADTLAPVALVIDSGGTVCTLVLGGAGMPQLPWNTSTGKRMRKEA